MLEFAKIVHEAIGIENPRAFITVFALFGLLFFGGIGWLLDYGYRTKLRNPGATSQASDSGRVSFSVKDLSEFGGLNFAGYKIYQALKLNEFSNGIDGLLLILIDERISGLSGEVTKEAYSEIESLHITLDPSTWSLEQNQVKQALLLLVDQHLKTIYFEELGRESARLDRVFLYANRSRPTFILTRDYSIGIGSYNGPISYFLEVSKRGVTYIFPDGLMTSMKSAWLIVNKKQSSEILYQTCRPNFGREPWNGSDPIDFETRYQRFHAQGDSWTSEVHAEAGLWNNENSINLQEFYGKWKWRNRTPPEPGWVPIPLAIPMVQSVSPDTIAKAGGDVTISGQNLSGVQVYINESATPLTAKNLTATTSFTVTIPKQTVDEITLNFKTARGAQVDAPLKLKLRN